MTIWEFATGELASYSILSWLLFISIAWVCGRYGGLLGTMGGTLLVLGAVASLDLIWLRSQMAKPGWDGSPDQDIVFMIGVFFRAFLVNLALLPASVWGMIGFVRAKWKSDAAIPPVDAPVIQAGY